MNINIKQVHRKKEGKEMEDWEDYEDETHGMWANENGDPRH